MRYTVLCAALALVGCHKTEHREPGSDSSFEVAWSNLAQKGAEPVFIEGDLHGSGLVGEVRRAVDLVPEKLVVQTEFRGSLPDDQVLRVIRQNLAAVKSCYQVEERAGTVGSGKAIVSLSIASTGSVSDVRVDAPAFRASQLPACVSNRARSWSFPRFTQGPKNFSYPFVFVGG